MNFLAHLYLSGDQPKIMIGNFIGDFVKGRNPGERFEDDVAFGIELHRSIDEFTDRHDEVQKSKIRLRPKYRHYSGVIVDMFYDHFLASKWTRFHTTPLEHFASNAYDLLQTNRKILPDQVNWMLPYMIDGNWLVNYGKIEGIHRALSGMSRRTPYESHMHEASTDLRQGYEAFGAEFDRFFPDLKKFADQLIAGRKAS